MSLIVLEGLDGSGKSTQVALLEKALGQNGKIRRISFPDYDSPSSALVKMYLAGEFGSRPEDVNAYAAGLFYAVDRIASYKRNWQEDYRKGVTILTDRYATSNLIYQMTKLPKSQWESYIQWVEDLEYTKLGLPEPDLVIFLDMPVEISQRLLMKRYQGDGSKKDIHERDLAFLRACGECARFAAQALGWKVIPCGGGGEALALEEIHRRVLEAAGECGFSG